MDWLPIAGLIVSLVAWTAAVYQFSYLYGWEKGYKEGMEDGKYYRESFDHIAGGG
jgi:hypothetical protein